LIVVCAFDRIIISGSMLIDLPVRSIGLIVGRIEKSCSR
jgi:hypothetical protein